MPCCAMVGQRFLAALSWLELRPVAYRCWFHLVHSYVLGEAEAFLWGVLFSRWTSVIQPLISAWAGIRAWWGARQFSTNNVAERGNGRLWRRVHRCNIRSVRCGQDWLVGFIRWVRLWGAQPTFNHLSI